jgi:hypothetical protein
LFVFIETIWKIVGDYQGEWEFVLALVNLPVRKPTKVEIMVYEKFFLGVLDYFFWDLFRP